MARATLDRRIGDAVEVVDDLRVRGLDAVDGTPVLDIKPVITAMRPPGDVTEPAWVAVIMQDYW